LIEADHEIAPPALCAFAAVAAEEAKTNTFADAPRGHTRTDRVDDTDDLVAGDDGLAGIGANALHSEKIAVAHPAAEDADADALRLGVDDLALDQLELTLSCDLESAVRRHGEPLGLVDST
jgi:hypothetical protein